MIALIMRRWPIMRLVIGGVTMTAIIRFAVREIPGWSVVVGSVFLLASVCLAFAFCFSWPWWPRLVGMRDPRERFVRFLLVFGFIAFSVGAPSLFIPPTFDSVGTLTGAAGLIFGSVTYLKRFNDSTQVV